MGRKDVPSVCPSSQPLFFEPFPLALSSFLPWPHDVMLFCPLSLGGNLLQWNLKLEGIERAF